MKTSVTKSITVEASREIAFRVFTQKMSSWWPESHHIGKSPLASVVLEPRVGGKWGEKCVDGSTCDWGRVLAWDPPNRVVLAWQLNAAFAYDPEFVTEVEVRFTAQGASRTLVELEHRNLDRYGDKHAEMLAAFESGGGWETGLGAFLVAARGSATTSNAGLAFFMKLNPPRPSFAIDMSDAEKRVMQEHVAYWASHVARGAMLAFGPVADPHGGYGVGILDVADEKEMQKLTAEDPAIRAEIGMRYEITPMPRVILRG